MVLTEHEADQLACKIACLALAWAGRDARRLAEAVTIIKTLACLGGPHHVPEVIDFERDRTGTRGSVPGEVCLACSDPEAGRWVPASQCPQARAVMDKEAAS
jgi:hypothetical protein